MLWFEILILRIVLPLCLCACVTIRPVILQSSIYLLFLFFSPYIPLKSKTFKTVYLILIICFSLCAIILQALLQEKSLRTYVEDSLSDGAILGIITFSNTRFVDICQMFLPDVLIFIIVTILTVLSRRFEKGTKGGENLINITVQTIIAKKVKPSNFHIINNTLSATCLTTLCISGAISASLINVIYFMTFLVCSTLVALNRRLGRRFSVTLKLMSWIMLVQIVSILTYQIKYFQEMLPFEHLECRLLRLYKLFDFDNAINFNRKLNWDLLLQPMVLIISYLIISNASRMYMKLEKVENLPENQNEAEIGKFSQAFKSFIYRQAFVIAIFSMMIWSIIYHSWLGFVYLMISNIIFIMSNPRLKMIKISPIISAYACLLILIDYIYGLNLYFDELPTSIDGVNLKQIGIVKYESYVGTHLIFKSLMTVPFWIIMRQKFDPTASIAFLNKLSAQMENHKLNSYVLRPIGKIFTFGLMWIIVFLMFILALYQFKQMTIFSIANMLFFLAFILFFQISVNLWKKIMYLYWIILIFYTKGLLILIYIYQFDGFLELPYHSVIGLSKYRTSELFVKLFSLIMITFLSGIQLNYYHNKFLKYIEPKIKLKEDSSDKKEDRSFKKKLCVIFEKILLFVEMHFLKIFYFVLFWTATTQIQIVNVFNMILLTIGILLSSERSKLLVLKIISFFAMLIIIGTMLYELTRFFDDTPRIVQTNCTSNSSLGTRFILRNFTEWFNVERNLTFYQKTNSYFGIIVTVTVFCGFKIRQEFHRLKRVGTSNLPVQLFNTTKNIDSTFFIKFLIDFGYKIFGVELAFLAFFILIFSRLDIISLFYIPLLIILIYKNRKNLRKYWMWSSLAVAVLILAQSAIIGFFILFTSCPFQDEISFQIAFYSIKQLHENPWILTNDYFLLMVMSCQMQCNAAAEARPNLFEEKGDSTFNSIKDVIMKFIFKFQFWIILSIIFFIGTNNVMLLSLGYITVSFIFYWQGTDFYLKPLRKMMRWWNTFLIYNVFIILFRYGAKLLGCLYQDHVPYDYCWILNFVDIPCSRDLNGELFCQNLIDESSYVSDIIIFYLIVFQKRIFMSRYFNDTIYDTYITNLLSARGAQIMEDIRIQEISSAIEEENHILEVIKRKMEVITHLETLKNIRDGNVKSHDIAVRNGDYYMFEDDFLEETDSVDEENIQKSLVLHYNNANKERAGESYPAQSKSREKVEEIINKSKTFKEKMKRFFMTCSYKLHRLSRKHTIIVKALDEERNMLKERLSLNTSKDVIYNTLHNAAEKSRNTYIFNRDEKGISERKKAKTRSTIKPEDLTWKDSLTELFYITLTHTDLLIYLTILINQCFYANMLSLPLPISIFFWATLTFPRPQKTFWILLIAYTQTIILLKCIFQLHIFWWDKRHSAVQLLGIDSRDHVAVFDLLLLFALFIHRTIQKVFGIWKTDENEFSEGSFELESKKPDEILKLIHMEEEMKQKSVIDKVKLKVDDSKSELLEEESKIIFRHELQDTNDEKNLNELLVDRKNFLAASEEIFTDNEGKMAIMITQKSTALKLYPINPSNTAKTYSIEKLAIVEHELEDPLSFYSAVVLLSIKQYLSLVTNFFKFLVPKHHVPRKSVDVYTFCFLCDFINFFVLLFGFSDFAIQSSADDSRSILKYFEENKVPASLLVLIIIQFAVIIIDRMLYLRKNMLGKVIYHYIMIICVHCWMFFILPVITKRRFNAASPPIIFYGIKFIYFLLSAYQIRCQFPARVLGNFLMRKYNTLHLIGHKIFMIIPFLFELRTLIDWTFTPTSLGFFEWMRVETIYNQVFQIKCIRESSKKPERGIRKHWSNKILLGGGLTLLIIGIIWFPLLLFAYSPSLGGQSGLPENVMVTIDIDNFEPIYKFDVRTEQMVKFSKNQWNEIKKLYEHHKPANSFLDDFDENDVVLLQINVNASSTWSISPPNMMDLVAKLKMNKTKVTVSSTYEINKLGNLRDKKALNRFKYTIIKAEEKTQLAMIVQGNSTHALKLPKLLPKFLHVGSTGKVAVVEKLFARSFRTQGSLQNIFIMMLHDETGKSWWKLHEDCDTDYHRYLLKHFPHHDCRNYLNIILLTEKLFPSEISSWAAKGILGFYITVVVFFSRILRTTLINSGTVTIIVEELPNVDKILNLCKNIYMVREAKQFSLEEDLVAKLLFLYRSPETLIKWTKYKES